MLIENITVMRYVEQNIVFWVVDEFADFIEQRAMQSVDKITFWLKNTIIHSFSNIINTDSATLAR